MTATGKAAQIASALFDHALLLATTGPSLPVSVPEPGKDFVVPASGKYLALSFFPNVQKWQGISGGSMDQGLLQISVIWPKREGVIKPLDVAQLIKDHFTKDTVLYNGSTKVKVSNDPWNSAPMTEDISVMVPVTIPWTA